MLNNAKLPVLAIECSSPFLSLALQTEDQLYTFKQEGQRRHSQFILPSIEKLLQQANLTIKDIKRIAVGNGPGSFIGVRLAHAVAQGLCLPTNISLATLSSLQIIAQSLYLEQTSNIILVAQDARKQEVYACAYQENDGVMRPIMAEQLLSPKQLQQLYEHLSKQGELALTGTGWQAYQEDLYIKHDIWPLANCELAKGAIALSLANINLDNQEPNYVRDHVADLPKS